MEARHATVADGTSAASTLVPVPDYVDLFVRHLRYERKLSPETIRAYESDLEQFLGHFSQGDGEPLNPADLGAPEIRAYLAGMSEKNYEKTTIVRRLAAIRSFYRCLIEKGLAAENPAAPNPGTRVEKRFRHGLTVDEVERLLRAPEGRDFLPTRDRAILETLYSTGLRVGELVALNVGDIDFAEEAVLAHGRRGRERMVPIGGFALETIRRYLELRAGLAEIDEGDPDALFLSRSGKRLLARGIRHIVYRCVRIAGLERDVSPYTLRHSFAAHLLDRGAHIALVQELLGHEKLASTQIYARAREAPQDA